MNVGPESPAAASERPVVLVADDEPSMLELVSQHLKTMHEPSLEVVEASDGEQAWKLAKEFLPDLVVLDVMMPGMSGWEVCRKIREEVALAHTAVVMLTGIGENLNEMTSPLYGADGYLDKPFEFEELDEKVRQALHARAKQRGGIARPKTNGVHFLATEDADEDAGDTASPPRKAKAAAAKKKSGARKSAAKRTTATKTAPKPGARKIAAKKAAAAKTAATKATAKKSSAKKTVAKKPAAKRPVAKQAAKKSGARPR